MHEMKKFPRIALWAAVLVLLWGVTAQAAPLHVRSLQKLQASIERVSPGDYTFVVLGDSRDNDEAFEKVLALAKTYNPLFILHGGDYSNKGSDQETDNFLAMLDAIVPEVPFFVVIGNHESKKVFSERIGPFNFTLDSARLNLKVISIDNENYLLKDAELSYPKSELATKRENTFVAMHIPPKTERWPRHTFSAGAEELVDTLAKHKVTAAFYFHVHLYDRDVIKGVPSIISAGAGAPLAVMGFSGEPVYHIVVVRVKGGAVTTEMVKVKE
ncbi:MAG: metallophosphoesterase family protein [Syntrophales bacterium]